MISPAFSIRVQRCYQVFFEYAQWSCRATSFGYCVHHSSTTLISTCTFSSKSWIAMRTHGWRSKAWRVWPICMTFLWSDGARCSNHWRRVQELLIWAHNNSGLIRSQNYELLLILLGGRSLTFGHLRRLLLICWFDNLSTVLRINQSKWWRRHSTFIKQIRWILSLKQVHHFLHRCIRIFFFFLISHWRLLQLTVLNIHEWWLLYMNQIFFLLQRSGLFTRSIFLSGTIMQDCGYDRVCISLWDILHEGRLFIFRLSFCLINSSLSLRTNSFKLIGVCLQVMRWRFRAALALNLVLDIMLLNFSDAAPLLLCCVDSLQGPPMERIPRIDWVRCTSSISYSFGIACRY